MSNGNNNNNGNWSKIVKRSKRRNSKRKDPPPLLIPPASGKHDGGPPKIKSNGSQDFRAIQKEQQNVRPNRRMKNPPSTPSPEPSEQKSTETITDSPNRITPGNLDAKFGADFNLVVAPAETAPPIVPAPFSQSDEKGDDNNSISSNRTMDLTGFRCGKCGFATIVAKRSPFVTNRCGGC